MMAYPRQKNEVSSPPMTFSRFIKETAERILRRAEVMTVSGLSTAIKNDQSCKYLQLKPATLHKIIQEYPESFSIRGSHDDPDVSLRLIIDVCDNMRNCPGFPSCKDLHICRYFMLDNCIHTKRRTRNPCPYPHSLGTKHNKKVLQHHHMLYLEVHTIKKMMQAESRARENAPLKLCYYYNRRVCERDNCPFLHLCEFYVKGTCKFGRRCKKNHDVNSRDVKEILYEYDIDVDGNEDVILDNLRTELYGETEGKEEEEEEEDSEEEDQAVEVLSLPSLPRRSYTSFRRGDRH